MLTCMFCRRPLEASEIKKYPAFCSDECSDCWNEEHQPVKKEGLTPEGENTFYYEWLKRRGGGS